MFTLIQKVADSSSNMCQRASAFSSIAIRRGGEVAPGFITSKDCQQTATVELSANSLGICLGCCFHLLSFVPLELLPKAIGGPDKLQDRSPMREPIQQGS